MSANQAARCETSTTKRCRCRCGGALHGARRFEDPIGAYDLDPTDPHHVAIPRRGVQLVLPLDWPQPVDRLPVAV